MARTAARDTETYFQPNMCLQLMCRAQFFFLSCYAVFFKWLSQNVAGCRASSFWHAKVVKKLSEIKCTGFVLLPTSFVPPAHLSVIRPPPGHRHNN